MHATIFNNAIVYGADQNQDWHVKDPLLYFSSTLSQLKPSTATHNNANELPMSGLSQNACKSATSEEKLRLPCAESLKSACSAAAAAAAASASAAATTDDKANAKASHTYGKALRLKVEE